MEKFPSTLHRLYSLFKYSFQNHSNSETFDYSIEAWSILVHEVMSARWRKYHTLDHIFEISSDASPLETLAIIFHDLVYLQVDRRVHPRLSHFLGLFSSKITDHYELELPQISPVSGYDLEHFGQSYNLITDDSIISIVYQIFGFSSGQKIGINSGLNEFLSALSFVSILHRHLSKWELITICCCIEATIPFRTLNEDGSSASDLLFKRLNKINLLLELEKTKSDVEAVVKLAVRVGNRDVADFGSIDTAKFIENSWMLVLEGNPIFRNPMHNVRDYSKAVIKIDRFLSVLNINSIFQNFADEPEPKTLSLMKNRASLNLSMAQEFFQTKLLSAAILNSIAYITGAEVPIVLFMGDITPSKYTHSERMESFLDLKIPIQSPSEFNSTALDLLTNDVRDSTDLDLKSDSLSAYIYPRINHYDRNLAIKNSRRYFLDAISADEFLNTLPRELVYSIIHAIAQIAWSRQPRLMELKKHYE